MKKKLFIIIGIILIIGVVGFIGFKVVNKVMLDKEIANFIEEVEANGETYLVIEINPKIILILDENNKVKEISKLNEDARIFIKEEFENLNLEDAINKVIEVAKENDYLVKDKKITLTTLAGNESCIEQVKQYIVNNDSDIEISEIKKSEDKLYKELYQESYNQFRKEQAELINQWKKELEEKDKELESFREEQDKIREEYEKQQEKWNARVKKCLPIIEAKGFVYKNNNFPCCDGTNTEGGCYSCNPTEEDARYCRMEALFTNENGVVVEEEEVCSHLYIIFDNYCEE